MTTSPAPGKQTPLFRRPLVFKLLLIALFAEIAYATLNISTMPVYLRIDRGFGAFPIAIILMGFLISEAVFKGPAGHVADRYGCKKLMVIAPAITLCTSILSALVPHGMGNWEVATFILLRLLDGVGAAMLWPAAFSMMSHAVADHERQQAMSLLNMCYLLGVALAFSLGGLAEDLSGYLSAGLYLAAAIFAVVLVTVWRTVPTDKPEDIQVEAGEGSFHIKEFLHSMRQIPAFLFLAIITFMGVGFPMAIIKVFAFEQFGMSGTQFGMLVLPGAIAMAALSVPMSHFGERIGRARAVHVGLGLCSVGLVFASSGAFLAAMRSPWVLGLAGIPIAIGFLLTIPAWLASVSDINPKARAANLGAVMTAQGLGAIVGLPLGGLFYQNLQRYGEHFGRYSPFLGCAACITLGWLISLKILKDHGVKRQP
jgi:MFS transporter, DHA1 family, multidrug resistance protein